MTALEILERVHRCGGAICLLEDNYHLGIQNRRSIPDELAAAAKSHAEDLRRILKVWHVDHSAFVVAREAKSVGELAACIACGGTWELHGSPPRERWRIVDAAESVECIAARFVLAKAQAIANGEA